MLLSVCILAYILTVKLKVVLFASWYYCLRVEHALCAGYQGNFTWIQRNLLMLWHIILRQSSKILLWWYDGRKNTCWKFWVVLYFLRPMIILILVEFIVPKMSEISIIWRGCSHNIIIDYWLSHSCISHHHHSNKTVKFQIMVQPNWESSIFWWEKMQVFSISCFFLSIYLFVSIF